MWTNQTNKTEEACNIYVEYASKIHLKLNLAEYRLFMAPVLVSQSLCNFARSTGRVLCKLQNDWIIVRYVMGKQDCTGFVFKMSFGWIIYTHPHRFSICTMLVDRFFNDKVDLPYDDLSSSVLTWPVANLSPHKTCTESHNNVDTTNIFIAVTYIKRSDICGALILI